MVDNSLDMTPFITEMLKNIGLGDLAGNAHRSTPDNVYWTTPENVLPSTLNAKNSGRVYTPDNLSKPKKQKQRQDFEEKKMYTKGMPMHETQPLPSMVTQPMSRSMAKSVDSSTQTVPKYMELPNRPMPMSMELSKSTIKINQYDDPDSKMCITFATLPLCDPKNVSVKYKYLKSDKTSLLLTISIDESADDSKYGLESKNLKSLILECPKQARVDREVVVPFILDDARTIICSLQNRLLKVAIPYKNPDILGEVNIPVVVVASGPTTMTV